MIYGEFWQLQYTQSEKKLHSDVRIRAGRTEIQISRMMYECSNLWKKKRKEQTFRLCRAKVKELKKKKDTLILFLKKNLFI